MNFPSHSLKRARHIAAAGLVAGALGGLAFACGSNDGSGPDSCDGPSCAEGGANESSSSDSPFGADTASPDASDAGADADAGLDANVDADAAHPPYTGSHIWSKLFGSNASSAVQGARMATDSAGNVFVAGTLTGDADFGGGVLTGVGSDAYVAKFTRDGNHLWSKVFGDADVQGAGPMAVDAVGNLFVGGNFNGTIDLGGGALTSLGGSDVWVAKFDGAGNHVWSKSFGDSTFQNLGALSVVGSDVVLIGANSGSIDFGGGALTGRNYLARLGAAGGAHVWSKQSTSGTGFVPRALTTDATGNIVGAGSLGSALDWGGGALTTAGGTDVLVIKFDSSGATQWSKRFGDAQAQDAQDVATDASGNILVTGRIQGALDFGLGALTPADATVYLAKLDKNGAGVWSKAFPVVPNGLPLSSALGVDVFGNVAIVGQTREAIDLGGGPVPSTSGATNPFIAKFDATGKHLWSKGWAAGGGGIDGSFDVAFDGSGNMLFGTSLHQSTIDLGGGPLASIGAGGFLILAKFAP